MDQHKEYQLWMQQLPAVGERRIKKLLSRFGSEREAYERLKTAGEQTVGELLSGILNKEQAECVRMFTRKWQLKENYERLREQEISFLTEEDGAYPERLRQMEIPPYGLYVKGKLPEGERAWAAVIGARECSSYGSFLAQRAIPAPCRSSMLQPSLNLSVIRPGTAYTFFPCSSAISTVIKVPLLCLASITNRASDRPATI